MHKKGATPMKTDEQMLEEAIIEYYVNKEEEEQPQ